MEVRDFDRSDSRLSSKVSHFLGNLAWLYPVPLAVCRFPENLPDNVEEAEIHRGTKTYHKRGAVNINHNTNQ